MARQTGKHKSVSPMEECPVLIVRGASWAALRSGDSGSELKPYRKNWKPALRPASEDAIPGGV